MPVYGLEHFVNKTTLISLSIDVCWRLRSGAAEPVPLCRLGKSNKEPPTKIKILRPAEHQAGPLQRILRVPPKSSFKCLILKTLLWQYAMSYNFKSLPEGLTKSKCKKRKLVAQPPILYVPSLDLHERQETKQIKVKMPDGTNFQMAAFGYGNNKEYLIHVIAILCIIEQKEMESDREGLSSFGWS